MGRTSAARVSGTLMGKRQGAFGGSDHWTVSGVVHKLERQAKEIPQFNVSGTSLGLVDMAMRTIWIHYLKGHTAEGHDYLSCASFVLSLSACIRCCRFWSQPLRG